MAGLPAGLLARALGLGGGCYTLDAACASSLYALKLAADELLAGYPPSSPSMALFRDGKPVFVIHRHDIESRQAPDIAKLLTAAFDRYGVTTKV